MSEQSLKVRRRVEGAIGNSETVPRNAVLACVTYVEMHSKRAEYSRTSALVSGK